MGACGTRRRNACSRCARADCVAPFGAAACQVATPVTSLKVTCDVTHLSRVFRYSCIRTAREPAPKQCAPVKEGEGLFRMVDLEVDEFTRPMNPIRSYRTRCKGRETASQRVSRIRIQLNRLYTIAHR